MKLGRRLAVVMLSLTVTSAVASAQQATFAGSSETVAPASVMTSGPRLEPSRLAPQASVVSSPALDPVPMYRQPSSRSRVLMIMGGAAIIGGAVVGGRGGNLVSLGGLGFGLYGLYLHLN